MTREGSIKYNIEAAKTERGSNVEQDTYFYWCVSQVWRRGVEVRITVEEVLSNLGKIKRLTKSSTLREVTSALCDEIVHDQDDSGLEECST